MTVRALFVGAVLVAALANAETYTILVSNRGTPAEAAAQKLANGSTVFAEPKLFKALKQAGELLKSGEHTLIVKLAGGQQHTSQGNTGVFAVPTIDNGKATLVIAGGYGPDWTTRDPFGAPSELITVAGRPGAMLEFTSNGALDRLVITGLFFDAAPSNVYDDETNSLKKGGSRSYPHIAFQQVKVRQLTVADNVFLNAAQGAFSPNITPIKGVSVVDVTNNIFLNNILVLKTETGGFGLKAMNLKGNSFLVNWPFNPDPDSSNVGAIELYNKECCSELNVEGNLFAYNPGGAMQHDWAEDRMPKFKVKDNLFFMNATLFGDGRGEAGLFAGKFGPSPKHLVITVDQAADDYGYQFSGNVSFDPKVPVALVELKSADVSGVSAKKSVMNDVRALFGANQQGGTVGIKNFAPRMAVDPKSLPFPKEPKAQAYGASKARVSVL